MKQKVIISTSIEQHIADAINDVRPDRLFILCDDVTARLCLPHIQSFPILSGARLVTIASGDANKNLDALAQVWTALQEGGATRHSMMVNLGGGMVTDLGGFAASTFKRGIHFINIPTTLLSLVDASVVGKTGIQACSESGHIHGIGVEDILIFDFLPVP